ncbi:MAG TPA: glycosyltransferase family 2 protein [Vicinamibacterales bacterium]|nr:glycosyltransferase family 2 protein [Vicinamibacterales bacterium]
MSSVSDVPQTRRPELVERSVDVSVVIVNFNTRDPLERCIRAIQDAIKGVDDEVIVVDNASEDGSVEMVRQKFPNVGVICNERNLFYTRATNQGIRLARGRYVLIVNPDVTFLDGSFERMYAYLERHSEVGAVSPRLVDADGEAEDCFCRERTFESCIFNFTLLKHIFPGRTARINHVHAMRGIGRETVRDVEMVVDMSLLVRRDVLEQIGMLDESFKLYFCDDDLSLRLRQAGWRLVFLGDVRNRHHRHLSVSQQPPSWLISMFRQDALVYSRKHFGAVRTAVLRPLMGVTAALHAVRS